MNVEKTKASLQGDDVVILQSEEIRMKRTFNLVSLMALGFNASNSWVALGSSIVLAIAAGGTVSLLYGIIIVSFAMICTGLSLAELASVFPTAGGQYHLSSIIAPERHSRWISYVCGLTGVFSWIAIAASVGLIITQFTMSLIISHHPSFEAKSWHYFLIYEVVQLLVAGYVLCVMQRTIWMYDFTCCFSIALFIVVSITCPVRASDNPDSTAIWTEFINTSGGWPDGISFLTGLSTPSYMLIGLDATMHLAEECLHPASVIPKAIMSTVFAGIVTAFTFSIAMCYSHSNISGLLESPIPMTLYVIWEESTNSKACATVFAVGVIWIAFLGLNACHQTASRLTWAFACDDGLLFSKVINRIHPRFEVPAYALLLNYFACLLIGILFLISSSAFNAFIGTANILSTVSISIPIALILYQGRSSDYLSTNRTFRLPKLVGYACNIVSVSWAILITIFFCFPTAFPVTGGTMNYSAPVLGIMVIVGSANWISHGRRYYSGPRLGDN